MKKLLYFCLLSVVCAFALPMQVSAQYSSPSMTYFKPYHIPTTTTQQLTKHYVSPGRTFSGTAYYSDGVLKYYNGCLEDSDGSKYYGDYTPNFQVADGHYNLYVPPTRDVAYRKQWVNGGWQTVQTFNIKDRSFMVNGTSITYLDTDNGGGYYGGGYNGGSSVNSGSSSSGSSHSATCSGCHGSGRCQHCNGTGLVNNNRSRCSLCGGSGRCKSCAGVGKIYL